jgi:hypothetical protein
MVQSPELQSRLAELRRRSLLPAGHEEQLTLAEMREAITALREDRLSASTASAEKKARGDPVKTAEKVLEGW